MSFDNMTSEDILKEIQDTTSGLGEGGQEEQEQYVQPDVEQDYEEDTYISEDQLMEQYRTQGTAWIQDQIDKTGRIPQPGEYPSFQQFKENRDFFTPQPPAQELHKAMAEDIEDLVTRYPKSSANFLKKVRRGEIQMPDELMSEPNALEQWFITSITEDEFRRMDSDAQLELFAKEGEERKPLRTRSLDIAEPRRKKPALIKQRPRQTYKLPELTQQDITDMMSDFINKHPERFRR